MTKDGQAIGSLCVIDHKARSLTDQDRETLGLLAQQTINMITLHEQTLQNTSLNQTLIEKAHLLDEISNDMPAMVIYWDNNQICRFVSQSYCHQIDKSIDEVVGQHYDRVVPPKLASVAKPFFLKALNGEMSFANISDSVYRNSDEIRHAQYIPDYSESGTVRGVLIIITDITYQRKAENNAALFSQVIGHSSDCIMITDDNYQIEYINDSFRSTTDYHLKEIAGKIPDFLFSDSLAQHSFQEIKKHLNNKNYWSGELWQARKNDTPFLVLMSIDAIKDINNKITHYAFSSRNQTENEKMRSELVTMTDMLNRTGKMAKVGGWELNLITNEIVWTDEVFTIHELEKNVEPNLQEATSFYPIEAKKVLELAIEIAITQGKSWDLELPFVTAKKNNLWVRATGECIRFNNKALKLRGTLQDITERKLVNIERENDELKHRTTLVKEVHHRIKNNLQGVSGLLSNFAYDNPNHADLFNEANAQLQSVAVIYGLQGQKPDDSIELKELSYAITRNIQSLWQTNIHFDLDQPWLKTYIEKNEAVPIALIMNELITNAVKHQTTENSTSVKLEHIEFKSNSKSNISNKTLITISNLGNYNIERDHDYRPRAHSGIRLMSALMPKRGAIMHRDISENIIKISLELSYPVVKFE